MPSQPRRYRRLVQLKSTSSIGLKEEDGELVVTISDNGRGITEKEKSGSQSLGLLGMRERAHLIGGKIDISGAEEHGTTVTLRIPNRRSE